MRRHQDEAFRRNGDGPWCRGTFDFQADTQRNLARLEDVNVVEGEEIAMV